MASSVAAAWLLGPGGVEWLPCLRREWKAIDVSYGPGCPKNLLEEEMVSPTALSCGDVSEF